MSSEPSGAPKISVITATRNRQAWLVETIESVQRQEGVTWELIVVNDASTDGTDAMMSAWTGTPLRYFRQEQHGERDAARNRGLESAIGRYVMFLDDDDLLMPTALRDLSDALDRHPQAIGAAGARWDWFAHLPPPHGQRDSHPHWECVRNVADDLIFGWAAPPSQSLYRAEAVRKIGGFRSQFVPCEDRDLWLRMAELGPAVLIPQTVLKYRVHPQQWRPPNIERIRERVFRAAMLSRPPDRQTSARRIIRARRRIVAAEAALSRGAFLQGASLAWRGFLQAPHLALSPLITPWVIRRLARRVWHRLRGR